MDLHAAIDANIPYSTPLDNTNSAVAMKNTWSNMGAKSAKVQKMLCDPCSDIDIKGNLLKHHLSLPFSIKSMTLL